MEVKLEEYKIDEYETDLEKRQILYPNVEKIEIIKKMENEQISLTIERQYRRYKVRPQISRLLKNKKKGIFENERIIYMELPNKQNEYIGGYQSIYIPSYEKYENIINKKPIIDYYEIEKTKIEETKKESKEYIPPNCGEGENISVVVKEIPMYMTIGEIKRTLKELFEKYGLITNINVLSKFNESLNQNMPIGIAFLDFCKRDDVDKLLGSNERFRISNSILKLELANGNKVR